MRTHGALSQLSTRKACPRPASTMVTPSSECSTCQTWYGIRSARRQIEVTISSPSASTDSQANWARSGASTTSSSTRYRSSARNSSAGCPNAARTDSADICLWVAQDGVDAERRRGAGEPRGQGELQPHHREGQEAQRHGEVDEEAAPGADGGGAE